MEWGHDGPARAAGRESLNGTDYLPEAQLSRNLDDLASIKRWLRYDAAVRRWLAEPGRRKGAPLTVLDAATGGADVPAMVARRAAATGLQTHVFAIDLHPQVAAQAHQRTQGLRSVAVARANALHLPLPDASVDVALCAYTLHHFEPCDARALLAELRRVARLGLVVTDLTRSWAAFALAWLLLHLWGPRHQLSQRDGPLSVRRAYTLREMQALAARAALPQPRIARRSLFEGVILAPAEVFGV